MEDTFSDIRMRKRGLNEIMVTENGKKDQRFKSIVDTYKKFTLAMVMGMMYPNPGTERRRIIYLITISSSFFPVYIMWFYDVGHCIQNLDLDNLTRQLSLGVPIMFCQFKMVLINVLRVEMHELIEVVNADYERYNQLDEGSKRIVEETRRSLLRLENIWTLTVILTVTVFPLMAVCMTVYHYMYKEPKRFMVHDVDIPWLREMRYDSPYFEIIFVYMLYIAVVLALCYIAYDGLFFVCIYHACLKSKLISYNLLKALKDCDDVPGMKRNLARIIEDQCELFSFLRDRILYIAVLNIYRFNHKIKKEYEMWLVFVFGLSGVQVCMTMYQLLTSSGSDVDPRYIIFVIAAIMHIYVPCYLVTKMSATSAEVANSVYCSGWEMVADISVRRNICIMLARTQIPLKLQAFNMIIFNMELFVSVMQTSYSVFTLLRPR